MIKAIFTNIKNENRYLEEWLNYHIKLGFNKFILYEDKDSDSHIDIINKYYGIINIDFYDSELLNDNDIRFKDIICFNHILNNYNDIDWIIKLDPDEYISLPHNWTIDDILYNIDNDITQITIDWKLFNANTYIECPLTGKYSLIDTYIDPIETENLATQFDINVSKNEYDWGKTLLRYKCFYNELKDDFENVISTNFPYQFYIDTKEHILDGTALLGLYINHYITKSFEEYLNKITVRGQYKKDYRKLGDFFILNPDMIKDIPNIEEKFNINIFDIQPKLNFNKNNI